MITMYYVYYANVIGILSTSSIQSPKSIWIPEKKIAPINQYQKYEIGTLV